MHLTDLMDYHIIWPKERAMWKWQRLQNESEKPSCQKAVKAIIWQSRLLSEIRLHVKFGYKWCVYCAILKNMPV